MKLTTNQTTEATLADLYRALDRHQPVTITYTKADGTESVRTIEPYEIATTRAGALIVKAMDRQSHDRRTFRLDRIGAYTLHRGRFLLERPAESAPVTLTVLEIRTPDDVVAREIAREDRDYWNDRYDVEPAESAA
ncbi:WYL domain-containing protein [Streptomyces boncukensis]|uniref:WYL domain-containing protein n=1 Tax=Streptomyces boncukensis TaxID=2711219 RepID=A0A6G4WU54_9ACTN|nr:WYL domain-containing protein [Streptomyces boncukensis]NGO68533.1 WYL domain-containing protein [Streptomyces boncukensis]